MGNNVYYSIILFVAESKIKEWKNYSLMRNPEGQSQGLPSQAHLLQKFKTKKLA